MSENDDDGISKDGVQASLPSEEEKKRLQAALHKKTQQRATEVQSQKHDKESAQRLKNLAAGWKMTAPKSLTEQQHKSGVRAVDIPRVKTGGNGGSGKKGPPIVPTSGKWVDRVDVKPDIKLSQPPKSHVAALKTEKKPNPTDPAFRAKMLKTPNQADKDHKVKLQRQKFQTMQNDNAAKGKALGQSAKLPVKPTVGKHTAKINAERAKPPVQKPPPKPPTKPPTAPQGGRRK